MITINLYDYKRVVREVGIQKNVSMVAMVAALMIVVCIMIYGLQTVMIGMVEGELEGVNIKVAQATPDYNVVQEKKAKKKKYNEIVSGINDLRSQQAPTTELLEDIGQSVPKGVWLTQMKQMDRKTIEGKKVPFLFIDYNTKGGRRAPAPKDGEGPQDVFIEIKGTATDDQPVVHFLEQLRSFPYFDAVVLHSTKREYIEIVPVQEFEIYCHFKKKPESDKS